MLYILLSCVNKNFLFTYLLTYLLNACAVTQFPVIVLNDFGVAWWRHQVSVMTWRVVNRRRTSQRIWEGFLYGVYSPGKWLWIDSYGKNEN